MYKYVTASLWGSLIKKYAFGYRGSFSIYEFVAIKRCIRTVQLSQHRRHRQKLLLKPFRVFRKLLSFGNLLFR